MKRVERVIGGYRYRSRELRPQPGEVRRWIVIRNGLPLAIKRTTRHFFSYAETAGQYQGYGVHSTEAVFVWARGGK